MEQVKKFGRLASDKEGGDGAESGLKEEVAFV